MSRPRPCVSALIAVFAVAPAWADVATSQPGATAPAPDLSVFQMFLKGGVFMYPLALCSVVAVTLTLDRLLALRRARVAPPSFLPGLRGAWRERDEDTKPALDYCRANDSPLARIASAGIRRLPHGWAAAERAMEDAGANEALRLRRNMRFLYALGSVATLLGLIGTISGMIKAFQVAAVAGVGRVDQLSRGIYEAMTCTFAGLAVAIVVTAAYYFFAGRIDRLVADLNDAMAQFADAYGYVAPPPPAAPKLTAATDAPSSVAA